MRIRIARIVVIGVLLLMPFSAQAHNLAGGKGGKCRVPVIHLHCTVVRAGAGWAFGNCEMGLAFSGTTKLVLKRGDKVLVGGCRDMTGNIPGAEITRQ